MSPEKKLNELLDEYGRGTKAKLAKYLGVSPVYVTRWVNDEKYNIPRDIIPKLEKYFSKNAGFFLGNNDEIQLKTIPLIGIASCGVPNLAYCDIIEHIPVPADLARDGVYAVKADGDSMLPKIKHGDTIICDKNKECLNGNIVHYTTIDGESGLKKYQEKNGIVTLYPLNTDKYAPIIVPVQDLKCARAIRVIAEL